jgi:hypothetical protein
MIGRREFITLLGHRQASVPGSPGIGLIAVWADGLRSQDRGSLSANIRGTW